MLVLSRREKQSLQIGDDLLVTVIDVSHDTVTVNIEEPDSGPVISKKTDGLTHKDIHTKRPILSLKKSLRKAHV